MNQKLFCAVVLMVSFLPELFSQVTAKDGQVYRTVKIGSQTWMAENLNVKTFRNGDPISRIDDYKKWLNAEIDASPAYCYLNNDPVNGSKFGKLYNGYAVIDPRGLCPEGWRVPTDEDWAVLVGFLGGYDVAGGKLMKRTDQSGFEGLIGEERSSNDDFYYDGFTTLSSTYLDGRADATWWTSTRSKEPDYLIRYEIRYYKDQNIQRWQAPMTEGKSVRCIRNQ